MKVIADLHIHSRFSRATSSQINIKNLVKYARIKGIDLLGTGDFTHPLWLKELKQFLKEDGTGILKTEDGFPFILSTEISSIYTQEGKVRKIHNIILSPDFETVEQINDELEKRRVNLRADGRPVCGIRCPELVEIIKDVNEKNEIIPAHVWTPWFSLFGSQSGFDSVEECFQDQTKHIHALETGLSSDPAMNWRISSLDKFSLVSFSDSHSFWPWRIGREATVFDVEKLCYEEIIRALKEKDSQKLSYTIEVDPSYGKYHFDGHRNCGVHLKPKDAIKLHNRCPVCGMPLTIGVLHRVEELADREEGFVPKNAKPFFSLLPLSEIIASQLNTTLASKKTWKVFQDLIKKFGSEFNILLNVPEKDIESVAGEKIAKAVIAVRNGEVKIQPGYDGVYGKPIFEGEVVENVIEPEIKQKSLMDF